MAVGMYLLAGALLGALFVSYLSRRRSQQLESYLFMGRSVVDVRVKQVLSESVPDLRKAGCPAVAESLLQERYSLVERTLRGEATVEDQARLKHLDVQLDLLERDQEPETNTPASRLEANLDRLESYIRELKTPVG